VGVVLEGVGNRAAHNLIHDGPRMGIMFSGNNLVIEYNHVRHMNLETEDTGAVYTGGRDWISSRGTVIRFNRFHDMLGFGKDAQGRWISPHFAWGVYLDDNAGGVDVIGNIIYRCSRAGLHLHNGRDNHISNNIFVDNGPQQYEYTGWRGDSGAWKEHLPTMIKGYELVASSPGWKTMRGMKLHPRDAVLPDGLIMTGNEFERNVIAYHSPDAAMVGTSNVPFARNRSDFNLVWHDGLPLRTGQHVAGKDGRTLDEWASWQALGMDRHSQVADPKFVDADRDDFRLRGDSPAFALGFHPIPVEKIGPHADELRASWPIVEAPGAREHPVTPPH
jgi:parallel beta-helix repeat protein